MVLSIFILLAAVVVEEENRPKNEDRGDEQQDDFGGGTPPASAAGGVGDEEGEHVQHHGRVHRPQMDDPAEVLLPSLPSLQYHPQQQRRDDADGRHERDGVAVEEDVVPRPAGVVEDRVAGGVPVAVLPPQPTGWLQAGQVRDAGAQYPYQHQVHHRLHVARYITVFS